jgi:hypothetical protein
MEIPQSISTSYADHEQTGELTSLSAFGFL